MEINNVVKPQPMNIPKPLDDRTMKEKLDDGEFDKDYGRNRKNIAENKAFKKFVDNREIMQEEVEPNAAFLNFGAKVSNTIDADVERDARYEHAEELDQLQNTLNTTNSNKVYKKVLSKLKTLVAHEDRRRSAYERAYKQDRRRNAYEQAYQSGAIKRQKDWYY